jgi:hypothetical protein
MHTPTPEILEQVRAFGALIMGSRNRHDELCGTASQDQQDTALIHCLARANEIALGCNAAAVGCLPLVLAILNRILIDELITVQWVCVSKENSLQFHSRSFSEMHKYISINIERKHAKLVNRNTGYDESNNFKKKSPYTNPHHLKTEERAKQVGLHRLYTEMYTFLSNYVHGSDILISQLTSDPIKATYNFTVSSYSLFLCIVEVVDNFIVKRTPTSVERIYSILKI